LPRLREIVQCGSRETWQDAAKRDHTRRKYLAL